MSDNRVTRIQFHTNRIDGAWETIIATRDETGNGWTITNGDGVDYGRFNMNPRSAKSAIFRQTLIRALTIRLAS